MKNYYSTYNKKIIIDHFPYIIRDHMHDHDIYFVTFTFENVHKMLNRNIYTNYFKAFYQKLNQYTVNRPSKNPEQKAKMILFPERSHKCKDKHMSKSDHYHGFLMIRKNDAEPFRRKCVEQAYTHHDHHTEFETIKYKLIDKLLNQTRENITTYSVDVEPISCKNSIYRISKYITKRFENPEDRYLDFTLEEIRAFQKPMPALSYNSKSNNPYFSCDDIQLFCDISKNNTKNYQAKRRTLKIETKAENISEFRAMLTEHMKKSKLYK